uniref:Hook microtubule tethering protein 3 n=1 Tax=Oreochromis niloticus TaxID=8128 RepID=A0A669DXJ6_ORENI
STHWLLLYNCIIQTFGVEAPCKTVEDLTSGVVMAQVLQKIDVVYFSDAWISRIKPDVGDNWRLKISNLKKILKGILDYIQEVLGQDINDFPLPDVNLIGEHSDAAELGRMLQLILGCAVTCEQKQEYIKTIMVMEESVQHVVMTAIQELMTKETPATGGNDSYVDLDRQLKKTVEELNDALATKEEIAQRCRELDLQVAALQEEKSSLLAENQVLMERLNQSDSIEDINSPAGRRHLQLQTQLEQLQEETFRLEAAKDDYRIRCEELEKELLDVKSQNEDLTSLADEAQSLKDEIDVLRHSSDKVSKLEGTVEHYKKKLEDMGLLRRQNKLMEEKNTALIEHVIRLQHENKMLKLAQEGSDNEKIALLQSLLEDANRRKNELETENRLINQRLMEEQSQVEELQKNLQEQGSKADDVSKCLYSCTRTVLCVIPMLFPLSVQRVEELEEALKKKDEDMKQMEERYKKYLEKAKSVIRTLDPKQNQGSGPEVQALKNQLQEKERMLHSLEVINPLVGN